jgi:hypothetical protein
MGSVESFIKFVRDNVRGKSKFYCFVGLKFHGYLFNAIRTLINHMKIKEEVKICSWSCKFMVKSGQQTLVPMNNDDPKVFICSLQFCDLFRKWSQIYTCFSLISLCISLWNFPSHRKLTTSEHTHHMVPPTSARTNLTNSLADPKGILGAGTPSPFPNYAKI